MKPRTQLKNGDILAGRYKVTRLLSSGLFGNVYEAIDVDTERTYMIKVFWKEATRNFPEYIDHLRAVSKKLARPFFPHLLLPLHLGETEEYFYIVQEFIDAKTLDFVIRDDAPLHPSVALAIVAQIAEALFSVHSNSVIHADVKPANILLSNSPDSLAGSSEPNAYLIDFGMAMASSMSLEGRTRTLASPFMRQPLCMIQT